MHTGFSGRLFTRQTLLFLGFVALLSYLTYFHRYWQPPHVFWDENYHIASAQKYLHGVYFMEQHPPLGKLLIALGEKLLHPNARTDQFLGTDYGTEFAGISFVGYRFFSALLGWWTAPLLFLLFLLLCGDELIATLLSFLYIFDNALIVHLRGAMLEGPLMFFSALLLLCFFLLLHYRDDDRLFGRLSLLFGCSFALVMTTKVVGLIFILLVPALLWALYREGRGISRFLVLAGLAFVLPYVAIWQTHFMLGKTINPQLPDSGYYQASAQYKRILDQKRTGSLLAFPVMLRDSWKFVGHYNRGAPRLDLCKADENGSPFYFWPVGARSISYRWETPNGKEYRYLYLQSNPVIWFTGLAAVLLAAAFLLSSFLLGTSHPLKHRFLLILFLGLYASYLLAMSRIERVMYLYHYFTPLLFSFILAGIVVMEIRMAGSRLLTLWHKQAGLLVLGGLIFCAWLFYRPFTYYEPLTDAQFQRRNLFSLWELSCVHCEKKSGLVIPTKKPE